MYELLDAAGATLCDPLLIILLAVMMMPAQSAFARTHGGMDIIIVALWVDDNKQGTTGQNRTKQTRAQKQAKQTKTNKALFTEQAADFGMWQQSRAAYAGRRQIHAIMESTSR